MRRTHTPGNSDLAAQRQIWGSSFDLIVHRRWQSGGNSRSRPPLSARKTGLAGPNASVLHARVQPNWIAPLYPSLAACAALAANAHWVHRGIDRVPSAVSWALATGLAMSGLLCLHAIQPIVLWPAAKDPSSQLRGWKQFAEDIDRLRVATGACWVATSHYAITGQLAYHLASRAPVVQVTEPIRYAHLPPVGGDILQCRALHVELARRALPAEVAARFGSVLPIGTLTRHYQGQAIAAYKIALLSDPLGPVAARAGPVPP